MENCIFCKIIKQEIPCYKIYEDEDNLAFLDVNPHAKGHAMVIPKKHVSVLTDLDDNNVEKLFVAVKKVTQMLKEKLNPDGFNGGWNNGEVCGQTVPHLHIHIMPRYDGDGGGSIHSIIKNPGDLSVEEVHNLLETTSK